MIYDLRTYVCRPGTIKKHMKLYEDNGWAAQCKHLGYPVVYGAVETGDVNSFVHIWMYDSATDRAEKRQAMAADPDWQKYLVLSAEAGYLVSQNNTILTHASFFDPLKFRT